MKHILLTSLVVLGTLHAQSFQDCYKLEDVALPKGLPPEVGGLTFDSDGNLYVVLRRNDVLRAKPVADPKAFDWKLFANGFHNGCGIVATKPGKILVTQMAELTSAEDTDGDGVADSYRNVADGWGLSGNYHETNDLCPDGKGGYFLAIGTASYNGPTMEHTKGDYSKIGRRGRNFSGVQYRGWVMHMDAQGKLTPWASGFRMHNGIHTDANGDTWSSDNQGDWKAITPFYHIEQGKFYGHPSSLVWDPSWPKDKDPLLTYRNDLDAYNKHRKEAAVLIPHAFCRSGSKPVSFPADGSFGKEFAGQYLLPDNNSQSLCRIMIEKVNGVHQGMVTYLLNGKGLRSGNNRPVFSPDGKDLYIGQTVRGWGKPAEGLQRLSYQGGTPFDCATIKITPTGFRLHFTEAVEGLKAEDFAISSSTYQPRWTYGSKAENTKSHKVTELKQADPQTVEISLADFEANQRLYEFKLPELKNKAGTPIHNRLYYYTVHAIPAK